MNTLSSLGSNFFSPQRLAGLLPSATTQFPSTQQSPSTLSSARDLVSLSKTGIDLSKQQDAIADRVDSLGNGAVDLAQKFLTNFAKSLFGDAANGMSIEFDSASVSASSSFSGSVQHSEGPNGSSDAAAFRLEDNASFTGKGVITTADGHRFNFEVEVQYQAVVEASSSRTTSISRDAQPSVDNKQPTHADAAAKPAKDLHVDFPGSVADLFHMMAQNKFQSAFDIPATDQGGQPKKGNLTLRLLDLIESPSNINGKLAKAYGVAPSLAGSAKAADSTEKS